MHNMTAEGLVLSHRLPSLMNKGILILAVLMTMLCSLKDVNINLDVQDKMISQRHLIRYYVIREHK